jgi:hypothetical protein
MPASAWAAAGRPSDGDLSARLAELAKPSVHLASPAKQAKELGVVREGPGSLLREGNRVIVEVRFDRGAGAMVDDLRAAGAKAIDVSRRYQTVTVAAKPEELRRLSHVPRVVAVTEVLAPIAAASSTCPSGVVVSEGDEQLRAGDARTLFGVDGSGVTVGILSDSFDRAGEAADESGPIATHEAEDVESGDLPGSTNTCPGQSTPVELLDDPEAEGVDEGRGMAQIVHDLAPAAELAFATAFTSETAFAENIEKLAKPPAEGGADAKVIVDDVSYFEEPFFQEGPVGVAVSRVAGEGVTYLSSAGNGNQFDADGHEIGSWEASKYRDSGSCPPAIQALPGINGAHCMDFNPGSQLDRTLGVKVAPGATLSIDLQWNEPWYGVNTDFDAFLLDSDGGLIAASGEDNIGVSQKPVEIVQWVNESASRRTVQLVVNRYAGGSPRFKLALLEDGAVAIEYPRSTGSDVVGPTVFGHNGAVDAISVGAVPFNDGSLPEEYSSRGPVTHRFEPVEDTEPAEALPSAETLSKPDVAATDCGATTFFGFQLEEEGEPVWRFCGTSAAAPHAAGVAALMLDAKASASPAEVRAALFSSAVPVGAFGACAVGAGLVEAVGATEDLLTPPSPVAPACSPPAPEGSVEEAQAPGFWGSEVPPTASVPSPPSGGPAPPPAVTTDETDPRTFLRRHPPRIVRSRRRAATVAFRFGADESRVTFLCRVDRGTLRECPERFVRRWRVGPHVLRVLARDAAGNSDDTPAVYRFRVKRIE